MAFVCQTADVTRCLTVNFLSLSLRLRLRAATLPNSHSEPKQCEFTLLLLSWVLPRCSGSCAAELTHSSPGPMLPQSTAAPLRTLEYSSAARPGQPGGRRQENGSQDRSPLIFILFFFLAGGVLALVWASYPSQHSAQEQETWLLTRVGGTQHLNLCLNSVQQSQRLSRGKIKQRAEVGNDRGCWARSRLVSAELWWHHLPGIMGISRKKAQVQHFFFSCQQEPQRTVGPFLLAQL